MIAADKNSLNEFLQHKQNEKLIDLEIVRMLKTKILIFDRFQFPRSKLAHRKDILNVCHFLFCLIYSRFASAKTQYLFRFRGN